MVPRQPGWWGREAPMDPRLLGSLRLIEAQLARIGAALERIADSMERDDPPVRE